MRYLLLTAMMLLPAAFPSPVGAESPAHAATVPASVESAATTLAAWPLGLLAVYCLLIVAGSLLGGWLPSLVRLTHTRMQTMISFVGGLMLGIGVFHLLPHALHEVGAARIDWIVAWMMAGIVVMFFLLRAFHFHHHGPADFAAGLPETHDPHHAHPHGHADDADHTRQGAPRVHRLSWLGVFFGLGLHTLIDGIALGASVTVEMGHPVLWGLFGVGTFAAILLHKPLDAVSITSLMAAGDWSPRARLAVNLAFALMCPLGVAIFLIGVQQFSEYQSALVGYALAFAAGVFLCIALSDLLPEMEFHSHHRVRLTVALLLGLVAAWSIRYLEPPHAHHHPGDGHHSHGHHAHAHHHHHGHGH